MIVPDGLRTNAYRVLRLSVSASESEVHKAAAAMRRAATLGLASTTEADIPGLGEVSRSDADIRAAVGRLANPLQRLTDRLLWFYQPAQPGTAHAVPDSLGPAGHDKALRDLFSLFESGLDDAGVAAWTKALRHWHAVICDDDYWFLFLTHEKQGRFEPAAIFSEVEAMRADAVRLAAEPLILAGRAALATDEWGTVRRILMALEGLSDTGPWAAAAQGDIASPAVERFGASCHSVREKYGSRVLREQNAAARNKSVCDEALEHFRGQIQPARDKVLRLLPQDHGMAHRVREDAALCLSGVATDYTWADEFILSEKLLEEALNLARNTLGAVRIEDGLSQIRDAARAQRVFGNLESIDSAPSLRTINGFGFTLYGKSDYDSKTNSHVTTYYFVALLIPLFPIARYRVVDLGGDRYRFLGKLPLRTADRWHLGIATAALVAMIVSGAMSDGQNSGFSSSPSPSQRSQSATSASRRSELSNPPVRTDEGRSPTPAIESRAPPAITPPASRSSELSSLSARIDKGRAQMSLIETQLRPVITELSGLDSRMKQLALDLEALDGHEKAGLAIDINDYNAKVELHNQILERRNVLIAANRNDMKKYEELSKKDLNLVDQYNSLLKESGR